MIAAYLTEFLYYLLIYAPFIGLFIYLYYGVVLKRGYGAGHIFAAILFLIYCLGVLNFCGSVTATDVLIIPAQIRGNVNLIPFSGAELSDIFLNVLLFVPFGFCIPVIFNGKRSFINAIIYAFIFSLSIEIGQLFKYRAVDVNDLIANTAGATIGFALALPVLKRCVKFAGDLSLYKGGENRMPKCELAVLLIFAYALRFFADPLGVKFIIWLGEL